MPSNLDARWYIIAPDGYCYGPYLSETLAQLVAGKNDYTTQLYPTDINTEGYLIP